MTIGHRLKLNILLSAAVVLVMSLAFASAFVIEKRASDLACFSTSLSSGMYDLNLLTEYYVKHQEQRPRRQWLIKYAELKKDLEHARVPRGQEGLRRNMEQCLVDLGVLFHELVASYESAASGRREDPRLEARLSQLSDLLILKFREISGVTDRFSRESTRDIRETSRAIAALFTVFALTVLFLTVRFSMRMAKVITEPICRLREGTETVRTGDLEHPVPVVSDDELGQLTRSFNEMMGHLKASTVSRAELERLVAERTADLGSANRELEAFSYSVSHDLRAPLRAIEGFTRILEEDYRNALDDEGKRLLAVIIKSTATMSRLIDDLLAFSRAGRHEIKHSPLDMEAMVKSIYTEIVPSEDVQRVEFTVHPLAPAVGDPGLIRQVWVNLLSNAVKFSSLRQRPVIVVGSSVSESEVVFCVQDNGTGFDMAYAGKLFGVFQRLHSAREFEGTGVGLAISQRIVNRHGGRMWAEAAPGRGATFFFTLPARAP